MIKNAETHSQTGPPEDVVLPRWMVERMLDQTDALKDTLFEMKPMIQRLHEDHLQARQRNASIIGLIKQMATEKTLLALGILALMILSLPAKNIGAVFKAVLTAALGLM